MRLGMAAGGRRQIGLRPAKAQRSAAENRAGQEPDTRTALAARAVTRHSGCSGDRCQYRRPAPCLIDPLPRRHDAQIDAAAVMGAKRLYPPSLRTWSSVPTPAERIRSRRGTACPRPNSRSSRCATSAYREGVGLKAEQFALDDAFRQPAEIERRERTRGAPAPPMQMLGDDLPCRNRSRPCLSTSVGTNRQATPLDDHLDHQRRLTKWVARYFCGCLVSRFRSSFFSHSSGIRPCDDHRRSISPCLGA